MEKIIKEIGSKYRQGDVNTTWKIIDNNGQALEGDEASSYFAVYWGETQDCPNSGKGDILFDYLSHSDKKIVEQTLGPTFFGIPYRGINH
jgi:hypothetical protein